ncbi:hypothetical protein ACFV6E_38905 [Streptomyces sp. NPDC059785]|uniref:hypothetical protein n=1 Tax=Streptomyces sp. NPDC059785 TaxID=3346945 RepID=UPI0036693661
MENGPRGRGGTPSIHQAALDNLRRGSKPVLIFLGAVIGLMALFVGGGMLFTWRSMPTVPTSTSTGTGEHADASASPTAAPASDARRKALVAFLTDAVDKDATRWFPGTTAETDSLTYTPLTAEDPGGGRADGLARVPYHDLPDRDARTVLTAVSRAGKIVPDSLGVSAAGGTDDKWELTFEIEVRGTGRPLTGEAEGYSAPSGTVITRLVYTETGGTAGN